MRHLHVLLAGLVTSFIGGAAVAQDTPLHWVCFSEVTASQSVGVRMTLVGPALRHNGVHTIYFTRFTTSSAQNDQVFRYGVTYAAFLRDAGYAAGGSANCASYASDAAAETKMAELRAPVTAGGGSVRVTFDTVRVDWAPEANRPSPAVPPEGAVTPEHEVAVLDARFEDLSSQSAQLVGLTSTGAVLLGAEREGVAEKAGLRRMDIVTELAGQAVGSAAELGAIAGRLRPGFKAPVQIWRDRQVVELTVEIPAGALQPPIRATAAVSPGLRLGVAIDDLDDELAATLSRTPPTGAVVGSVRAGGAAAFAGVWPLDVVVALNGAPVDNAAGLQAAVASLKPGPLTLQVWRRGAMKTLTTTAVTGAVFAEGVTLDLAAPGACYHSVVAKKPAGIWVSELYPVERLSDPATDEASTIAFVDAVRAMAPRSAPAKAAVSCGPYDGAFYCGFGDGKGSAVGRQCSNDAGALGAKRLRDIHVLHATKVSWKDAR